MKKSKFRIAAMILLCAMLLGGCGEPLYNLTENEKNIIVDYSAHLISKFNARQTNGIVWVDYEAEAEKAAELAARLEQEQEVPDETEEAQGTEKAETTAGDNTGDVPEQGRSATLNELFGMQGISIEYTGSALMDDYVQDTYYAMYPEAGKKFLVLQIDVANTAGVDVEVDNLVLKARFYADVNGSGEVPSELSILQEDFAQLQSIVAADTVTNAVLLFQVPDSITDIADLQLYVMMNGEKSQIIL